MPKPDPVHLFDEDLFSIHARLIAINKIWHDQDSGGAIVEFPDAFPVMSSDFIPLGHIVFNDDANAYVFQPAMKETE